MWRYERAEANKTLKNYVCERLFLLKLGPRRYLNEKNNWEMDLTMHRGPATLFKDVIY